jgi:hypothetical protein
MYAVLVSWVLRFSLVASLLFSNSSIISVSYVDQWIKKLHTLLSLTIAPFQFPLTAFSSHLDVLQHVAEASCSVFSHRYVFSKI